LPARRGAKQDFETYIRNHASQVIQDIYVLKTSVRFASLLVLAFDDHFHKACSQLFSN
jgi:hypothetical protein